tara:strand:- start:3367 stop:3651 length:285 start_codon:yes stop_codon:yes gene_type:complete
MAAKSRTAKYYAANPEARRRRVRRQAEINRRPSEKKKRRDLARERRKRGIMGKGGKDVSHRSDGSTFLESPSVNRGRQGAGGKPKRAPATKRGK